MSRKEPWGITGTPTIMVLADSSNFRGTDESVGMSVSASRPKKTIKNQTIQRKQLKPLHYARIHHLMEAGLPTSSLGSLHTDMNLIDEKGALGNHLNPHNYGPGHFLSKQSVGAEAKALPEDPPMLGTSPKPSKNDSWVHQDPPHLIKEEDGLTPEHYSFLSQDRE
jgi:hypothetical protein